jgi:hypothetical protein
MLGHARLEEVATVLRLSAVAVDRGYWVGGSGVVAGCCRVSETLAWADSSVIVACPSAVTSPLVFALLRFTLALASTTVQ